MISLQNHITPSVAASTTHINYKKNNYKKNNSEDLLPIRWSNSVQLSTVLLTKLGSTVLSELGSSSGGYRKPATSPTCCSRTKYLWHNQAWHKENNQENNSKDNKEAATTTHSTAGKL